MTIIKTPFLPVKSIIRSIIPLAPDNHLFNVCITEPARLTNCRPGQFIEMWLPGVGECPISVCSRQVDGNMELCVRRVGRVTGALFGKEEGDWIGLRGPYGNGWPLQEFEGQDLVLIAGGLGIAPIRSLWQHIIDHREQFGKIILIYGMRHSIDLLFRAELQVLLHRRDMDVYIAAEAIIGPELPPITFQLGRVTDMLRNAAISPNFRVAACGPHVMYRYLIDELTKKGVPEENMWLLVERHMKCGFGKCGHCFVSGTFSCRDGPVFRLTDLRFIPEAIECN